MKRFNLAVSSLIAAQLALSSVAMANNVNVHTFTPAANPSYMVSEDALLQYNWGERRERRLYFGVYYDMVNDPLVELNSDRTARRSTLVDSMHSLNLSIAYSVMKNFQMGVSTTASLVQMPNIAQKFGMSDSRVFGKVRLNNEKDAVVFALMPELFVPTGDRSLFLSNDSVGGGMRLIAEHDFRVIQAAANIGYRYVPSAQYRDLNMKQVVPLSLGLVKPLGSRWAINAEASGELVMPLNKDTNPSAFYLGGRYRISDEFIASAGAAIGAVNGYSSANYQVIAGLSLMPQGKKDETPVVAKVEVKPTPAPAPVVVSAVAKKPRVVFTPKEIDISEEVKFKHNKATLEASGKDLLDEVAKVIKENKDHIKTIVIEGHTNEIGSVKHNQKLSQQRSNTVKEYLISRGVSKKMLTAVGYGKSRPKVLATDASYTKEARLAANRRVEFKVISKDPKAQSLAKKKSASKAKTAVSGVQKTTTPAAPAATK